MESVVARSPSTWLNPVVLTREKNGDLRFCLDLRKLNEKVQLDEFEIPKIEELTSKLTGYKYFSTIDLSDGFFQVKIKPDDKQKPLSVPEKN